MVAFIRTGEERISLDGNVENYILVVMVRCPQTFDHIVYLFIPARALLEKYPAAWKWLTWWTRTKKADVTDLYRKCIEGGKYLVKMFFFSRLYYTLKLYKTINKFHHTRWLSLWSHMDQFAWKCLGVVCSHTVNIPLWSSYWIVWSDYFMYFCHIILLQTLTLSQKQTNKKKNHHFMSSTVVANVESSLRLCKRPWLI